MNDFHELAKQAFGTGEESPATQIDPSQKDLPLNLQIAAQYKIPLETAEILMTAPDEETLVRQAEGLVRMGHGAPRPSYGSYVPNAGKNPTPPDPDSSMKEFVKKMFGNN